MQPTNINKITSAGNCCQMPDAALRLATTRHRQNWQQNLSREMDRDERSAANVY